MATPIVMPKQGNTVEECVLTGWRKHKGDRVEIGDIVADIETDKAAFEVESPVAGEMLATFFEEGDLVPVLLNICVVGDAGEDPEPFRPDGGTGSGVDAPKTGDGAEQDVPQAAEQEAAGSEEPVAVLPSAGDTNAPMSPRARRFLREHPFQVGGLAGSGPNGRIIEKDVIAAYQTAPRLSPVAAEMAKAGKTAPAAGTGVRGMVRGVDMGQGVAPAAPAAAVPAPAAEASPAAVQVERLSNIRKIIAERMHESLATTAQFTLNAEADATALLTLRNRIKANQEELDLGNVNITDMVVYAAIKALLKHPEVNSVFVNGELHRHSAVHMAVAIDTPRGLMVPVIPDSQMLSLRNLSARIKELARQANAGSVSPDLLSGGTFTVSSMGAMGITSFTPVLNPPQVAILGICATQVKPVRRGSEVVFADMIQLSLTCNHMVLDGAPGARFLQTLRSIIENFDLVCLAG